MAEDTLGSPNFDVWAMMMRQRDHNFGSLKLSEILDGYQRVGVAAPATGFLPPPAAAPTAAAALEPINGTGKEESTPIVQSLAMCGTQGDADRIKELFLGMGNTIALWKNDSVINWVARRDGYPSLKHAVLAAQGLYSATEAWNEILEGRVRFQYVERFDQAAFQLVYAGEQGGVLASAWFPDAWDSPLNDLKVYARQFGRDVVGEMAATMAHELGHVLGLRHEFAASASSTMPAEDDPKIGVMSILWGMRNDASIMNYYRNPTIQKTDITGLRSAYDELKHGQLVVGTWNDVKVNRKIERVEPRNVG